MKIGIFAKTWEREGDLRTIFRNAYSRGIESFQFNMCLAGGRTMPKRYDAHLCDEIGELSEEYGIELAAMSGTFNLLHRESLYQNLESAEILLEISSELHIPVLTLCTGTNHRENMWKYHPDNDTEESWERMKEHLTQLLKTAEKYPVSLGIEPEVTNVVSSAAKARQLLDEMSHGSLKIVMDAANLFKPGEKAWMRERIRESVMLLKDDIVLAHAKDCVITDRLGYRAAGLGDIDFGYYLRCLKEAGYGGSLILHGLSPEEVPGSINYLQHELKA